ncbi:hypothetical protein PTKIN_Ptkin15bG0040400 [Pterospermum kingtungense]
MAINNKLKTLESRIINQRAESKLEPESEDDLQELESDVRKMTEKILECRSAIPDQLKTTLASILSTHRPNLPGVNGGSEAGPSGENNADSEEMELDKERRRTEEKIRSLKEKISSSISAVPVVVKRLKVCISRIEKLDSCNGIIHPAFKKKIC